MKKILFFDIDGTLLEESSKKLKSNIVNKVKSIQSDDVITCIATGRNYSNAINYANELNIDNLVLSNGINIFHQGKEIKELLFTDDELQRLRDLICPHSEYIGYVNKDGIYIVDSPTFKKNDAHFVGYGDINLTFVPDITGLSFQKISINTPNKAELDAILESLTDEFIAYRWTENQCEIQLATQSKATGIEYLLSKFDGPYETYAFGDGVNDIEMMKFVDHPIVMGNAYDVLKEYAEVIIGDIADDGLLKYLEEKFS